MPVQSVTVFGGDGFIGRYVVRQLARSGAAVQIACRNTERAGQLKPAGEVGQITPLACDITNYHQVRRALETADAAVNLCGILQPGAQSFEDVHIEGPRNIARACREFGIRRFVHVSALGANPESASKYARSKAEGEREVRKNLPEAVILRPSIVFGPEDDFFNRFARMAKFTPVLPLIGGGHTRFQPVYVGDVADAIDAALRNKACRGQIYELGGPQAYTFRELLEKILAETGQHRGFVSLPFWLASVKAFFWQMLPNPPLTPDQVRLLKQDNVVQTNAKTLADLGVSATALEMILSTYLAQYRPRGYYTKVA